ncbi:MAG TPA: Asp-tRNA(Asn)/Glu-tRNA(Gln) amidotransferase subunit GatB [Burkholderiales bacterium]|jgi:aspartyl-tRNA(Asn)/glutamyl-tRNA(Gln) amidotransferase subunit B|nr:Asp-tRNA(Asn)/Glu-tRNA(Gln) amidotransferase subunit GatB [Burkholderiales bacterium]
MEWEIVIGIETHAQLSTRSKIFSPAPTEFGAAPNTRACAIDMALPGTLPVLNKGAVERAIRFGLAIGGTINRRSIFARKNYFYPDLPKGYQISQYELPIVQGGSLAIHLKDGEKVVRLTRAHLEEDAGKSLHEDFHDMSGIDLNRAGTPLLEIVSEPDLRSAEEAVAYAKALHALVRWIDICDGNMQEGSFRCDANVSVRRPGAPLGTRREIKNLNSFRFLQQAIEYEAKWQIEMLEDGGRIEQATVLFNPDTGETRAMRSKEDAHDYRYFPDPDLLPLEVSESWIEDVRGKLPELPQAKRERYIKEYGLSDYDSAILTASRSTAEYFEHSLSAVDILALPAVPKQSANLIAVDVAAYLNRENIDIEAFPIPAEDIGKLARSISNGTISSKMKKEVLDAMRAGEGSADEVIEKKGLKQISDSGAIEKIVDEVLAANPQQVTDYRSGKEKAFNSLVGQVMKATKGKANPGQVNEILKKKLG